MCLLYDHYILILIDEIRNNNCISNTKRKNYAVTLNTQQLTKIVTFFSIKSLVIHIFL